MIHKITNTKWMGDVYFEDVDKTVSSQDECYLIDVFYFYYFSTLDAAKEKAKKLGISCEMKE